MTNETNSITHIPICILKAIATWLFHEHLPSPHFYTLWGWVFKFTITRILWLFSIVLLLHFKIGVIFICWVNMLAFDKEKSVWFSFGRFFYLLQTWGHIIIIFSDYRNMRNTTQYCSILKLNIILMNSLDEEELIFFIFDSWCNKF